jgi:hypothetical protein
VAFSQSLTDYRLYTVEEVLAEFLTFCSTSGAHIRTEAVRTVRNALNDPQWMVFPQSHTSFLDALTLYESRPDKEYSLTELGRDKARCLVGYVSSSPPFRTGRATFTASGSALSDLS